MTTDGTQSPIDRIFAVPATQSFEFDEDVAEVFDDMVTRSVPFYGEQQRMVTDVGKRFFVRGSNVYDIGCATGTTLVKLASALGPNGRFVGYDVSEPMLAKAHERIAENGLGHTVMLVQGDIGSDLSTLELRNASVVTMCWTLQFVAPAKRESVVTWINRGLLDGGAMIVAEKVLGSTTETDRLMVDLYYDMKRQNGYSDIEIIRKREALQDVLIPCTVEQNIDLFRRCGFDVVESIFRWHNFAAFLCIKNAG